MEKEQLKFEKRFDTSIKEVIVLTQDGVGAGKVGAATLWNAHMKTLAYVDVQTGAVIKKNTILTWQLTDAECRTKERIFNLKKEWIYRLKVRKSLPDVHENVSCGLNLMVVEVLERNCRDDRLEEILREYQKPVKIHPLGCSELLLDKSLGMFDGDCKWNGERCMVHLDVDEDGAETAEDAIVTLAELLSHSKIWDDQARKFAASELAEMANEWQPEDEENALEISKEDFEKRLTISELCISIDGDFEIFYDDDDMFWGHVIIVSGNIKKGLEDATIAG
ncbi:DUF2262 domain-containing protein [Tissierella praeacuta]|uniref:DUF2262 domain-containing protein n=1 Tax=Tissierella praeacuta TaxID=43131 RepID=UPI00333F1DF2